MGSSPTSPAIFLMKTYWVVPVTPEAVEFSCCSNQSDSTRLTNENMFSKSFSRACSYSGHYTGHKPETGVRVLYTLAFKAALQGVILDSCAAILSPRRSCSSILVTVWSTFKGVRQEQNIIPEGG